MAKRVLNTDNGVSRGSFMVSSGRFLKVFVDDVVDYRWGDEMSLLLWLCCNGGVAFGTGEVTLGTRAMEGWLEDTGRSGRQTYYRALSRLKERCWVVGRGRRLWLNPRRCWLGSDHTRADAEYWMVEDGMLSRV